MSAHYHEISELLDSPGELGGWPDLKPLEAVFSGAKPFPFEAMGAILGGAAQSIAADVQAPDALAGGSVLAAASLASSPLANVYLPHGQRSPLSLYVITGAASGDRKSATDAVACYAIDEHRKQQARQHAEAMKKWESENDGRKAVDRARPPSPKVLTTGNATTEGIAKTLKSQSVIGLFSAEGGEMLGGHSLRDDKRVAGLSFLLKAWSGEALDSLRGGDGLSVLLGRRIAIHVLVQPVLLAQLLADPLANGQGFLARCLIAMPNTLAGSRLFRQVNPMDNEKVVQFNNRLRDLLSQTPRTWGTGDGFELRPDDLHMAPDAHAAWIECHDQFEKAQALGGELADARPFASKAVEQAARIAGVIAIVEGHSRIEYAQMRGGIQLAEFYLNEHLRLTCSGKAEKASVQLRALYAWMRDTGPIVLQTTVLQKSPRSIRSLKAERIKALLAELEERGYIRSQGLGTWEVRDVQG